MIFEKMNYIKRNKIVAVNNNRTYIRKREGEEEGKEPSPSSSLSKRGL